MKNYKCLSDVHLEFYKGEKFINLLDNIKDSFIQSDHNDFLLLAGDIGRINNDFYYDQYKSFLDMTSQIFQHVILIPGNHEYYGSSFYETDKKLTELTDDFDNVTFLNNSVFIKDNVCILGTTLWAKGHTEEYMKMNDFYQIQDFVKDYMIYPQKHEENKKWLHDQIGLYKEDHNLIILTHHQPSFRLIHSQYKMHKNINHFFASSCDDLFSTQGIKYWVYGHTHTPFYGKLDEYDIHFVCNPYGYPEENHFIQYYSEFQL